MRLYKITKKVVQEKNLLSKNEVVQDYYQTIDLVLKTTYEVRQQKLKVLDKSKTCSNNKTMKMTQYETQSPLKSAAFRYLLSNLNKTYDFFLFFNISLTFGLNFKNIQAIKLLC